jgi:methylated-DNA-protein-cysteine methyltransferase-like protein
MSPRNVDSRAARSDAGAKRRRAVRARPEPPPEDDASERIYRVVSAIPRGKVATYGQVALLAGIPAGHRIAARAMRDCPEKLAWYRVLAKKDARRAKIALGDPEHARLQERRLRGEGVRFDDDGYIALRQFGWLPVEARGSAREQNVDAPTPARRTARSSSPVRCSLGTQTRANRATTAAEPRRNR